MPRPEHPAAACPRFTVTQRGSAPRSRSRWLGRSRGAPPHTAAAARSCGPRCSPRHVRGVHQERQRRPSAGHSRQSAHHQHVQGREVLQGRAWTPRGVGDTTPEAAAAQPAWSVDPSRVARLCPAGRGLLLAAAECTLAAVHATHCNRCPPPPPPPAAPCATHSRLALDHVQQLHLVVRHHLLQRDQQAAYDAVETAVLSVPAGGMAVAPVAARLHARRRARPGAAQRCCTPPAAPPLPCRHRPGGGWLAVRGHSQNFAGLGAGRQVVDVHGKKGGQRTRQVEHANKSQELG